MGFERLAMITQGVQSNYDTDLFQPIIQQIAKMSNREYGNNEKDDIALRVIADHLRAIVLQLQMVNFHQILRLDTLLEEYLEEQSDTDILF